MPSFLLTLLFCPPLAFVAVEVFLPAPSSFQIPNIARTSNGGFSTLMSALPMPPDPPPFPQDFLSFPNFFSRRFFPGPYISAPGALMSPLRTSTPFGLSPPGKDAFSRPFYVPAVRYASSALTPDPPPALCGVRTVCGLLKSARRPLHSPESHNLSSPLPFFSF